MNKYIVEGPYLITRKIDDLIYLVKKNPSQPVKAYQSLPFTVPWEEHTKMGCEYNEDEDKTSVKWEDWTWGLDWIKDFNLYFHSDGGSTSFVFRDLELSTQDAFLMQYSREAGGVLSLFFCSQRRKQESS